MALALAAEPVLTMGSSICATLRTQAFSVRWTASAGRRITLSSKAKMSAARPRRYDERWRNNIQKWLQVCGMLNGDGDHQRRGDPPADDQRRRPVLLGSTNGIGRQTAPRQSLA